jgi:hypothetical protein
MMGIHETAIPQHWNYFLALDDDVVRLARYLEPTESNFSAHSLELARILFAAASEVDVVAKRLCSKIDSRSRAGNIMAYMTQIVAAYPDIAATEVLIPKFGMKLTPWERWGKGESPLWWVAYNKVKHHRHTHFSEANLKHALNAVAGLFTLLLYFYRDEAKRAQLSPDPALFRAGPPFRTDYPAFGPHVTIYARGDDYPSLQT